MGSNFSSKNLSGHEQSEVEKPLSVAFILAPDFTLSAFSNFIDALRLAADDGDFSRQIRCKWKVLSYDSQAIKSSCGVEVIPQSGLIEPTSFDYIVVVGGLLHSGRKMSTQLVSYLKKAAELGVSLVGLCTGSFILARAGLMDGHKSCVSWFHHHHFESEFPSLSASSDNLFIIDGKRMTCAGAAGVVHLAANIIEGHCGKYEAVQALRIMLEEMPLPAKTPQPQPLLASKVSNINVRKAMLLIERNISNPLPIDEVARKVNLSNRQLERLFHSEVGMTPASFSLRLRLESARNLLINTDHQISFIATECGFVDFSHFSRSFRIEFGITATEMRKGKSRQST